MNSKGKVRRRRRMVESGWDEDDVDGIKKGHKDETAVMRALILCS
jgi:hypothetical protein